MNQLTKKFIISFSLILSIFCLSFLPSTKSEARITPLGLGVTGVVLGGTALGLSTLNTYSLWNRGAFGGRHGFGYGNFYPSYYSGYSFGSYYPYSTYCYNCASYGYYSGFGGYGYGSGWNGSLLGYYPTHSYGYGYGGYRRWW